MWNTTRTKFGWLTAGAILALGISKSPAASVKGTIHYEGPAPKQVAVKLEADPNCVKIHGDKKVYIEEEVIGAKGEVKNAFVYIKNPPAAAKVKAPAEPITLDQKGCSYEPRVQAAIVGQKLNIVNSDPTSHNIRCLAKKNRQFNVGQPVPGTREQVLAKAEMAVKFKCDIHPWMTAYIFVMEHALYSTTSADGAFEIKNLPAGEYTLVAWHEKYGQQELKLKVADQDIADANFTFKPKAK